MRRFKASPWVETCAASRVSFLIDWKAASFLTRSVCALVYSVLSCSKRAVRIFVFSSGLIMFNSRSKRLRASELRSILARSSSSCCSMKSVRLELARMRML